VALAEALSEAGPMAEEQAAAAAAEDAENDEEVYPMIMDMLEFMIACMCI